MTQEQRKTLQDTVKRLTKREDVTDLTDAELETIINHILEV